MKAKYRIDRSKWRCGFRGHNAIGMGETMLLNDEGYMCCLGQIAKQDGVDDYLMRNCGEPAELEYEEYLSHLCISSDDYSPNNNNTQLSTDAMKINDNEHSTHEQKEEQLIELFAKHNIELEFYGEGVPYHDEDTKMAD